MRTAFLGVLLIAGLSAAGCAKKDVLTAKVEAVYRPSLVMQSHQRLASQDVNAVPLPEGAAFIVVASSISNPTRQDQSLDQDKIMLVDQFGNTVGRIGITVDCNAAPAVMEYDGHLGKLTLKPGQTLRNDPQATCFVFIVPAVEGRLSLRVPGAADTPVPPAPRNRPPAASAAPPSSDGLAS